MVATLFPTAEELNAAPVDKRDDLSRIQLADPNDSATWKRGAERAARNAQYARERNDERGARAIEHSWDALFESCPCKEEVHALSS